MPPSDRLVDDLADAILDGTPIDWAAAESSSEGIARPLVRQLRGAGSRCRPPSRCRRRVPRHALNRRRLSRSAKAADAPVHWGHLRVLERIGRGAFGEVYRAWDTRLDREVALKLLPASRSSGDRAASPIIHEGRLLARVRHPNVVTIYGAEQIGDQIGLWMEFVRGQHARANPRPTEGRQRGRGCRDRSRALSRDVGGARRRSAPSGYQDAQRDASRGRAHRADGLRHWPRA